MEDTSLNLVTVMNAAPQNTEVHVAFNSKILAYMGIFRILAQDNCMEDAKRGRAIIKGIYVTPFRSAKQSCFQGNTSERLKYLC